MNEDYEQYEEGFQAGEEAAERLVKSGWMDVAEEQLRNLLFDRYGHQSEMWWRGFRNGKDGNWDPPESGDE